MLVKQNNKRYSGKPQLPDLKMFLAGVQWLFFIFTNIVVIPLTVGAAFHLQQGEIAASVQRSFIFTGIACILQATFGHRLPLMEGQTGLWWGVVLNTCASAVATHTPLSQLGGALSVGIIISGALVMLLGALGLGKKIAGLFSPVVMSVFLFLLSSQLIIIFLKGMLGISVSGKAAAINVPVAVLSIVIALLAAVISLKGSDIAGRFAILISIVIGWITYQWLFPGSDLPVQQASSLVDIYPWGQPSWNIGIIIMALITGILSTSNIVGAIKGGEKILGVTVSKKRYGVSFILTGAFSVVSGLFGMVPYSPYVSSLGFLETTRIYRRLPLIIGAVLFALMGIIYPLGKLFSTLPLSIGSAVLFVAYLQLFGTALNSIKNTNINSRNIYRVATPTLLGIAIMNLPYEVFLSLPVLLQPLISNGMIVGIALALILENCMRWDDLC